MSASIKKVGVSRSSDPERYAKYWRTYQQNIPRDVQKQHCYWYPDPEVISFAVFENSITGSALVMFHEKITAPDEDYPACSMFFHENDMILLVSSKDSLYFNFAEKKALIRYTVQSFLKDQDIQPIKPALEEMFIAVGRNSNNVISYDTEVCFA